MLLWKENEVKFCEDSFSFCTKTMYDVELCRKLSALAARQFIFDYILLSEVLVGSFKPT